jgi:CRISPR system Cascade subunit CasD
METVFLRLCGPMQSWGTTGRFDVRGTEPWPTKSGVVGLVAAAMGIDRHGDISVLAQLRMGVAVLAPGQVATDYQTAIMSLRSGPRISDKTAQSWRSYIAGGDFLVSLTGDPHVVQACYEAVSDPVWPLFLGRRSYAPSLPIATGIITPATSLYDDIVQAATELLSTGHKSVAGDNESSITFQLTTVVECGADAATTTIPDQPLGTFADRRFGQRYVSIGVTQIVPLGEAS